MLAELVSSKLFSKIIFAVDTVEEIPKLLYDDPRIVVYERCAKNSQDGSSSESVMIEIAEAISVDDSDFVFLFQATNPFLRRG